MKLTLLATAALLLATPVMAGQEHGQPTGQTQGQGQGQSQAAISHSQSAASAHSASTSTSRAQGGNATNSVNVTQSAGNGSGGGRGGRTPDLYAPSINGGSNCSVGISLGGVGQNAGGTLGYSWESEQCSLRQAAAMMASMGDRVQAREALCHIDKLRRAYYSAGTPCARDAKGWDR